jgi:hypothetical protein
MAEIYFKTTNFITNLDDFNPIRLGGTFKVKD